MALAETDVDVIAKSKSVIKADTENGNGDKEHSIDHETEPASFSAEGNEIGCNRTESTQTQTQRALKLSFTLPASCYATMAIRELLKTSTSVSTYKALSFFLFVGQQINTHSLKKLCVLFLTRNNSPYVYFVLPFHVHFICLSQVTFHKTLQT